MLSIHVSLFLRKSKKKREGDERKKGKNLWLAGGNSQPQRMRERKKKKGKVFRVTKGRESIPALGGGGKVTKRNATAVSPDRETSMLHARQKDALGGEN